MAKSSGMRLEGVGDLSAALTYSRTDVVAAAADAMKTGAKMLKQRARDYAPVDEGDLEESIKISNQKLSQRAAAAGQMSIEIGVDGEREKKDRPEVTVGQYAGYMESGEYNLGPKSEEKNDEMAGFYARDTSSPVGPGFFSRAMDDGEPYVLKVIAEKVKQALSRLNGRTGIGTKSKRSK